MRPSSIDLRERVAAAVDEDKGPHARSPASSESASRSSPGYCSGGVRRIRWPRAARGGPTPAPSPDDLRRLEDLVREHNDDTLDQLKQRGGFNCSLTTISRPASTEIDLQEEDPARRRARPAGRPGEAAVVPEEGEAGRAETAGFRGRVGGDHGDDPGHRRAPARRAGRRLGPRLVGIADRDRRVGSGRGTCPLVFPGSTDTAAFESYVEQVLVPELHAGDVVVWDNLSPHQAYAAAAAVRRAGARLLPLPPYSPDYTPIERLWSKVKAYLRRVVARGTRMPSTRPWERALEKVTTQDIIGWFQLAELCEHMGKPL